MATRIQLHNELCEILESNHCYFNPPESIKMKYPCFVYSINGINQVRADNKHYLDVNEYNITYISSKSNSDICERFFEKFPSSRFDRKYVADNLYHYVFTLYY